MLKQTWQGLMNALGWVSLAVGIVGVFLPLLPTTPFVLLAAYFFSRGSKRLHRWLVEHPSFGRYVRDWEAEQVIPPIGKYAATLMMVPSVGYAIATRSIPLALDLLMVATVGLVLWFIWTRPTQRAPAREVAAPDDSGDQAEGPVRVPASGKGVDGP